MRKSERPCSIPESLLWTCSYQFGQALVLLAFFYLLVFAGYGFDWPSQDVILQLAMDLNLDRSFLLIGVTSLGALFVVVPLIRLRLGPRFRESIGWRTPRHEEVIFALATVIPIAVLGDLIYELSGSFLQAGITQRLSSQTLQTSSLEYLQSTLHGVPYPILVVALALGPAVGEELIFRGVIGRGLVHRHGVWTGSVMTAFLFAIAHVSPSHAISTLPIAFLLQFLYLKTGTIWIPIFVHFCNNLVAVSMMRYEFVPDINISPFAAIGFLSYLIVILVAFESRRRNWNVSQDFV
ncbi:CPBP family intramembrane glutamic endopeptidase [Thalassoglobus polymorphus]|uniref:CAAX amino terminal protease self-immunity n=1 Tax=Thalassoglobus polymorphus TaxID=2527994 RepID=A0A517QJ18_9PLAN|nr:type II CAAX endopeptidase family protein [Thalassoglobus polymorphus]QDT31604.1 CAAX amino terminal protease self- immunity [Thalassoglobus polymorphus]